MLAGDAEQSSGHVDRWWVMESGCRDLGWVKTMTTQVETVLIAWDKGRARSQRSTCEGGESEARMADVAHR